jgi:hypothetical protein
LRNKDVAVTGWTELFDEKFLEGMKLKIIAHTGEQCKNSL